MRRRAERTRCTLALNGHNHKASSSSLQGKSGGTQVMRTAFRLFFHPGGLTFSFHSTPVLAVLLLLVVGMNRQCSEHAI